MNNYHMKLSSPRFYAF